MQQTGGGQGTDIVTLGHRRGVVWCEGDVQVWCGVRVMCGCGVV